MRLTSEMFCSALTRAVFGAGGFAAIQLRGAEEAGAIFIVQRKRSAAMRLLGPAPQAFFMATEANLVVADTRRFEVLIDGTSEAEINGRLAKEQRYDADIWIVEVEADALPEMIRLVET